jgi:hypothetical protein
MYGGGTAYIETGGKEPIEIQLFNRYTKKPLLGKTNIRIRIRRHEDDLYYDWSDDTFKAYGSVVQINENLSLISDTASPGLYRLNTANHDHGFDTSKVTNWLAGENTLEITVTQVAESDADGLPTGFELKVGSFLDTLLRIVALQKENYFIDQTNYNTEGLLLSGRIRLFRTKAEVLAASDGGSGEGEFATYTLVSTPVAGKPERADVVTSVRDS